MMAKGYIELYGLSISLMNRDSCRRIDLYYCLPNHLSYLTLLVNIFIINMISLLLTPLYQPRNVEKNKERDTILISRFDEVQHYSLKFKFPENYVKL